MTTAGIRDLHQLARLYGAQSAYRDLEGRGRTASIPALLAVLGSLGAPVAEQADVPAALRARRQELWRRCTEPVAVAWDGASTGLELRLPAGQAGRRAAARLELENGGARRWAFYPDQLPATGTTTVEGQVYAARRLTLPGGLPPGYHRLRLELPAGTFETTVIAAPRQAHAYPIKAGERIWGVFIPLYALRSRHSWAAGDLSDLKALLDWVRELGGGVVGTLPLLSAFLDEPFDPSPYAPASRLFWNEFFLDVTRVPELADCRPAQELLESPAFREELAVLQAAPLVDYRRGMAVKRRLLEELAHHFFAADSARRAAMQHWVTRHPQARDYARFRAVTERRRAGWPAWPGRMRDGQLQEGDYDPQAEYYHLYVQWLADAQLQSLADQARGHGPGLYLDLPLGVHGAGYDVWRERAAFALDASAGAPPDPFFSGGQDWGFPPLHPERIRTQAYRYHIAALRHHVRCAGLLRIDHIMGWHRLFWIPRGLEAQDGVYVRYRAEEFWAVLTLESQRHRTLIVGEDLGTVPREVRSAMDHHRVDRMYVLPFELGGDRQEPLNAVPKDSLAALNTHDMPPFAAYWRGMDDGRRAALSEYLWRKGWLDTMTDDPQAVLRACLAFLGASRARVVMASLEDLWLETKPQNCPGTYTEYPNWRRKAHHPFDVFTRLPGVRETLRELNRLRR